MALWVLSIVLRYFSMYSAQTEEEKGKKNESLPYFPLRDYDQSVKKLEEEEGGKENTTLAVEEEETLFSYG